MDQITVYGFRAYDEAEYFAYYEKELELKLVITAEAPTLENAYLAKGSKCIIILTSKIGPELMKVYKELGVSYISTRTIGYDHIDGDAALECQIRYGNATYGPEGVSEYTIMMILMSIRKMKTIMQRSNVQDYTLKGLIGSELKDFTVGVIGTGRIGRTVIRNLTGFGCKIIANDVYESEEIKHLVTYVTLEEMWEQADLITIHAPLTDDNYHLINEETIKKMKDGIIIVNTARGDIIDTNDLIEAVQSKKIGAAALDVIEDEFGLYYADHKGEILDNRNLAILRGYPNVIITHHMAFYTDNAIKMMVGNSLTSCKLFLEEKENPWEIQIQ